MLLFWFTMNGELRKHFFNSLDYHPQKPWCSWNILLDPTKTLHLWIVVLILFKFQISGYSHSTQKQLVCLFIGGIGVDWANLIQFVIIQKL